MNLSAMLSSQAESGNSQNKPPADAPAQFTRMSSRPPVAVAASTTELAESGMVRSAGKQFTSPPPLACKRSASSARLVSVRAVRNRDAPSSANSRAQAVPRPPVAPVISATLPFNCRFIPPYSRRAHYPAVLESARQPRTNEPIEADSLLCSLNRKFSMHVRRDSDQESSAIRPIRERLRRLLA